MHALHRNEINVWVDQRWTLGIVSTVDQNTTSDTLCVMAYVWAGSHLLLHSYQVIYHVKNVRYHPVLRRKKEALVPVRKIM